MPPAEIESAPSPPEGDALSAEPWGRMIIHFNSQPRGALERVDDIYRQAKGAPQPHLAPVKLPITVTSAPFGDIRHRHGGGGLAMPKVLSIREESPAEKSLREWFAAQRLESPKAIEEAPGC